jgi:hypothetical protein
MAEPHAECDARNVAEHLARIVAWALVAAAGVLAVGVALYYLLRAPDELERWQSAKKTASVQERAAAVWAAHPVRHYRWDVSYVSGDSAQGGFRVEVRDGAVVAVTDPRSGAPLRVELDRDIRARPMERWFERDPNIHSFDFDPATGIPTQVYFSFSSGLHDDASAFFKGFTALP